MELTELEAQPGEEKQRPLLDVLAERQAKIASILADLNEKVALIRSRLLGESEPTGVDSDKPEEVVGVTRTLDLLTDEIERQTRRLRDQIATLQRL